jgi:flavorubredoxin
MIRSNEREVRGMQLPLLSTTAQEIAQDTWLIPTLAEMPTGGYFGAHSLVIRGAEPVIVDTGCRFVRDAWLEQVFAVVEPADVRWVFVSHDDHDHIGNLDEVLARCPNATLVVNFGIVGRLALDVELPLERMRWVEPGDGFDAGDRSFAVLRPPTFDSPTSRALFDPHTGVLWAADSFGALVQGEVYEAADVPPELYEPSFAALNSWNTPWLEWIDRTRFDAHNRSVASLPIDVVASAHGPVLRDASIDEAFRRTLALAGAEPVPAPGTELLDLLVGTLTSPAAA